MADTAKQDLDLDILFARLASLDGNRSERRGRASSSVGLGRIGWRCVGHGLRIEDGLSCLVHWSSSVLLQLGPRCDKVINRTRQSTNQTRQASAIVRPGNG